MLRLMAQIYDREDLLHGWRRWSRWWHWMGGAWSRSRGRLYRAATCSAPDDRCRGSRFNRTWYSNSAKAHVSRKDIWNRILLWTIARSVHWARFLGINLTCPTSGPH